MSVAAAKSHLLSDELAQVAQHANSVIDNILQVYVGPRDVPELLLVALLTGGHALLEGVPGVAKTTLVKAFAASLGCLFRRIQFTPDLLPSDITGTYVLSPREGTFELRPGPIFAHVLLGDEINRAPAKTQSALLEAMQERQVTIEGETMALPNPFIVLATQNPVEQTGTYPLPEAQMDRFLVRAVVGYPTEKDEREILHRFMSVPAIPEALLSPEYVVHMQNMVHRVHVDGDIFNYAVKLSRFSRQHPRVVLGASPRASLALVQASRALAFLRGRAFVLPDDVKMLATSVLAHRLVLTPEAEISR